MTSDKKSLCNPRKSMDKTWTNNPADKWKDKGSLTFLEPFVFHFFAGSGFFFFDQ